MKQNYIKPTVDFEEFESCDVVSTSLNKPPVGDNETPRLPLD